MKTVYLSDALRRFYPETFYAITNELWRDEVPWKVIDGTDSVWCRDWMPVVIHGQRVKFTYHGGKGVPREPRKIAADLYSQVVLDGGNVEQGVTHVLMTDMVFRHNPGYSRKMLTGTLEDYFGKPVVFLPVEPGDTLGHVDGIARFNGYGEVLINDYWHTGDKQWCQYGAKVRNLIEKAGLKVRLFPWRYDACPQLTDQQFKYRYPHGDENNPALGYYLNFTKIGNLVLVPEFGLDDDTGARLTASFHFPGCRTASVPCHDLAMTGGAINCVTHESEEGE